jgi:hypothetical protein
MDWFEEPIHNLATWLNGTAVSAFMQGLDPYSNGALETLHLFGMALLLGTVGVFDLRVLGFARSVPATALHKLIPWGVLGFAINLVTGSLFVIGQPHAYLFDPAFRLKVVLIIIAGINVLLFYGTAFAELKANPAGASLPLKSRIITAISLTAWGAVLICGGLVGSGFFA